MDLKILTYLPQPKWSWPYGVLHTWTALTRIGGAIFWTLFEVYAHFNYRKAPAYADSDEP
jgi:hypothetical protein